MLSHNLGKEPHNCKGQMNYYPPARPDENVQTSPFGAHRAGPRVRVVMSMGMELAMVKVWRLLSGPMGMWVMMADPRVRVEMVHWKAVLRGQQNQWPGEKVHWRALQMVH